MRPFVWRVPQQVLDALPPAVRAMIPPIVVRNFRFLDVCAGRARITKWAMLHGMLGAAVDSNYGDHMDICSDIGFALLVTCLLRVVVGGLMFLGPRCSSWVWMSRFVSRRSRRKPLGNKRRPFVAEGNKLNVRCGLACAIASMIQVDWVIEQPASSLFFDTPLMKGVIKFNAARKITFPLSEYGHPALKMTMLVGTAAWLSTFAPRKRLCPKAKAKTKAKAKAKVSLVRRLAGQRVRGEPAALKGSQVYPARFALAVVAAHWPHESP